MSFYSGLPFFGCLAVLLVPAALLGILEKPLRWYGLTVSAGLILVIFGQNPKQLGFLVLFYLWELALVKGYEQLRKRRGRNSKVYGVVMVLALLPIVLSKLSEVAPMSVFQFLGISYLTFRVAQVIIELYDGLIEEVNPLEFTGFLLFFPTLSCGPIDRSRRFSEDWQRIWPRSEYLELLGDGLEKLLLGAVYKLVFAAVFFRLMGFFESGDTALPMIGYAYCYGFYMFFDFAGYSLMAIGTSYVLGVRTPKNFDRPFLSVDIKDFWNRWHITLSHWFRDFLFTRFMMQAVRRKWFPGRLSRSAAGFVVNMLVMGLWHGLTIHYVLYGLYHGLLLAGTEVYQKKSNFYKRNQKKKWYRVLSWFVTLNLVMLGFLIFSGHLITI